MGNKAIYLLLLTATLTQANQNTAFEEITVQAFPLPNQISSSLDINPTTSSDSAEILKSIPGANNNTNGTITGIAQYRGMFGDRISVKIDNAPTLTGGPNAMDTPLSYAPSGLLKELVVYRGIAPVSVAQESIGGHMVATLNRGQFSSDSVFKSSGYSNIRLSDNDDQSNADIQWIIANKQHKYSLLVSHNEGENFSAGRNTRVTGSQYQRDRLDIAYGWKNKSSALTFFTGQQDIANTGTPALAMDIINVDTHMAGFDLHTDFNNNKIDRLSMAVSWADVDHGMDNHSLRAKPTMTMKYRHNQANAKNIAWSFDAQLGTSLGELKLGTDGDFQSHNSIITNPNNPEFKIQNFTHSERDNLGVFAELNGNFEQWSYQVGIRHNRIELNSGPAGAEGMMNGNMNNGMSSMSNDMPMGIDHTSCQGMQSCASILSGVFNQSSRSINFNTNDLVLKLNRAVNKQTAVTIDLGIKQRAPSYRETFLWLPLPITGGLADGRNYTGNLSLTPETSREITLGLSNKTEKFSIQPQIFYRSIDNYIQGTPSNNAIANKFSQDMSGSDALMYSNTSAKIYGLDANWSANINNHWLVDGLISHVRGKRTDTIDNLYRIAPTNARISLRYSPAQSSAQFTIESIFYARQKQVASYANESETKGYKIINLSASWSINNQIQLRSGITNLFDRFYTNHLNGVNRVGNSEIAIGDVIPGTGRAFYLLANLVF